MDNNWKDYYKVAQVAQEMALDPYILGIFDIVTGIPAEWIILRYD